MKFAVSSRVLAVLAIVAGLGLATPSAFADISYIATDLTNGGTMNNGIAPGNGDTLSTGKIQVGHFQVQVQSSSTDPSPSTLSTTTIDIDNKGTNTSTIEIEVSSQGFTTPGGALILSSTVQGTSSKALAGQKATGQTWIDNTNTLFGMPASGTAGSLTGTAAANGATTYTFPNGGQFADVTVAGHVPFSLTQEITITLAAGKQGQITISSSVNGVPEPSSLALAGIGALGMIGFHLRRRKASGA
jgi:hypothetical protein